MTKRDLLKKQNKQRYEAEVSMKQRSDLKYICIYY